MMSKIKILITVLALILFPTLLAAVKDSAAAFPTEGIYYFYGRVMNQQDKPVANCNVVLVKSLLERDTVFEGGEPKKVETKTVNNEELVAVSDLDGNFSFSFEPLGSNDFWVFFMAEGYRTRSMELNTLMKSRMFPRPSRSPLKIHVILERN
jgi:hypothetical protein